MLLSLVGLDVEYLIQSQKHCLYEEIAPVGGGNQLLASSCISTSTCSSRWKKGVKKPLLWSCGFPPKMEDLVKHHSSY